MCTLKLLKILNSKDHCFHLKGDQTKEAPKTLFYKIKDGI